MVETEERALVVTPESHSGLVIGADIADLTDEEFERRLTSLQKREQRIQRIKLAAMQQGSDYGLVPGTDRPTLLKGGAEKLTNLNGLVARIETDEIVGDGVATPTIRYRARCWLHVGDFAGPIVGHGEGIASSWEKKYRYVTERRGVPCPDCGKEGVVKTRRNQFWHPTDAKPDGGCNANFPLEDERFADLKVTVDKIDHPNPWDMANTLLKMAEKRSHVDAVLRATGVSGLFTQDVEDMDLTQREAPHVGRTIQPSDYVDGEFREEEARPSQEWSVGRFRYQMRQKNLLMPVVAAVGRERMPELEGRKLEDLTPDQLAALWGHVEASLNGEASPPVAD